MLVVEVESVKIVHPARTFADLAEGALAQGTDLAEDARDGDPLGAEHREPILREQACGGREKREVALELGSGSTSVDVVVRHFHGRGARCSSRAPAGLRGKVGWPPLSRVSH